MTKLEANQEKEPLPEGHADKKATLLECKSHIESQLAEQDHEPNETKQILAVKDKDKLNLIMVGPEKSGRSSVASYLAQEHQRCVIKLDTLFDFCLKRGLPIADKT